MLAADQSARQARPICAAAWGDAQLLGVSQALALVPGVVRSGVTITAALARGLTREAAARFSFLLSGPTIVGAALFKLRNGVPPGEALNFLVGVAVSGIVGWLAIGVLLRYVQRRSLLVFVAERVVIGAVTLLLAIGRGASYTGS